MDMGKIYSVAQVNSYIKNIFFSDFVLRKIRVQGEVSNCKYHNSGHLYFTLKDEVSSLCAVMFAGSREGLDFKLEEGMNIIVSGSIEVYEKNGSYQIYARRIEKAGRGDLFERFLALKQELEEMGMFAPEYKRALPLYAKTIGIITAKEGAALQDIIHIAKRRNPFVQLVVYPSQVQGERAAKSMIRGIKALDKYGVDLIILGRGGGSIEDLWAFNDRELASAIFEANTPIISAVGHETDFTIADFVADLRAPTPSAAAELAAADILSLLQGMEMKRRLLKEGMYRRLNHIRFEAKKAGLKLSQLSPSASLGQKRRRLMEQENMMRILMRQALEEKKRSLLLLSQRLRLASAKERLAGGYAFVTDKNFRRVSSVSRLRKGDPIKLRFSDGSADAIVSEVQNDEEEKRRTDD